MRAYRAVGLAAALCWLSLGCGGDGVTGNEEENPAGGGGGGTDTTPISVEGIVYAKVNTGTGCPSGCFTEPLPGAQVSTSLDGSSVTTDSAGRFRLVTTTQSRSNCTEYAVVITAQGYAPYRVTGAWGNHPQGRSFALFPPMPTAVARC